MTREWQVGDVAIRTGRDGSTSVSLVVQADRLGGDCWGDHGGGKHWHHSTGAWNRNPDDEKWGTYRRLVVIDPEDTQAAERLVTLFLDQFPAARQPEDGDAMQDALREFADPTPPSCSAVLHIGTEQVECERDEHVVTLDHRNDSIGQGVRWSA